MEVAGLSLTVVPHVSPPPSDGTEDTGKTGFCSTARLSAAQIDSMMIPCDVV